MKKFMVLIFLFCFITNTNANIALDEINGILLSRDLNIANTINQSTPTVAQNSSNSGAYQNISIETSNNIAIDSVVSKLARNYKFVLFYKNECPHCKRFNPILKQYSQNTRIAIEAFTFDQEMPGLVPDFENSVSVNPSLIQQYFGGSEIAVPTLFIMNTINLHVFPVSRGELTYSDLVARMNVLTPKILQAEEGAHV